MSKQQSKFSELDKENEEQDKDQTLNEDLGVEAANVHNLAYNKEENSFEYDVIPEDKDYDHPDPYHTAVKNGGDINSDYDEANPTAVDEYDEKDELVDEGLQSLGMHIDNGGIVEVSPVDEELSKTPEDERDDLDEEGYPKNDMEKDNGDMK